MEEKPLTIELYLEKVARFADSRFGGTVRGRFADVRGDSELAMLAAPTLDELEQLKKAVAIMTPAEKAAASRLSDEQIARIAADACVDPANLAIFLNGYALHRKRVS